MKIDDLCNTDKISEKLSSVIRKYTRLSSELTIIFGMMKKNKEKHDEMMENFFATESFSEDFFDYKMFLIENSERATKIIKELEDINKKLIQ